MTKEDYKLLKRLIDEAPKEFTADETGLDETMLLRFAKEAWLRWWLVQGTRHWSIEHPAKEALEEYEQELDAAKDRKAGNRIALCALLISIAALLLSGTSLYLQYL